MFIHPLVGIKVKFPDSVLFKSKLQEESLETYSPKCEYNQAHDEAIVFALIKAGLTDSVEYTTFRMWALGIKVINPINGYDGRFPVNSLVPLFNFVQLTHPNKTESQQNHIFRSVHWYLSCMCTYEIQSAVLKRIHSWIQDYNNSHTPHS